MSISETDLAAIEALLAPPGAAPGAAAALRQRLPHLSLTRCDASDMAEAPFRVFPDYDLHLVSAADHCVQVTTDPAAATGLVLARRAASA
ncbi:DUF6129 family protein [Paracraurococcus lichenis]|uniref:DUF6129 family protein n=1 Tax=Paracraurococcus lichenis TaxID=3064888 RepID=A0ABT9DYE0_9PROT|nr:DUF6129 family protein [Paracraurococcus sp. LOR1-02]MDO9708904.1 DUF6129 family protein [Paracraurococcus sp. LOR1-02]